MTKELHFTEQEILTGSVTGLAGICGAMLMFIKKHATRLIKKRNNNIEQRLLALEANEEEQSKKLDNVAIEVRSLKNHSKRQSSQELVYLKKIMSVLDKKHPDIWEDISE
jgi:hypothetical protein